MPAHHIHIDAMSLTPDFESFLIAMGFWRSDFDDAPNDVETHTPANHLTLKPASAADFKEACDKVLAYVKIFPEAMKGYIEGEFLPLDLRLDYERFESSVKPPFTLQMGKLPPGTFRESEIHPTFRRSGDQFRCILLAAAGNG